MNTSIALTVSQFKRNWTKLISEDFIQKLCSEIGYNWRRRVLEPGKTFQLFLLQILHGNVALSCVPHLASSKFTASALCQARQRLPLKVFENLLESVSNQIEQEEFRKSDWCGHRVLIVDGSGFSMPDTEELQQHFPQSKNQQPGCGFPTAKFVALLHYETGMISRVSLGSLLSHDMSHTTQVDTGLSSGDVLLGDRAYCSFAHYALLLRDQKHAVTRAHQSRVIRFQSCPGAARSKSKAYPQGYSAQWLEKLGHKDQLAQWNKPYVCPKWISLEEYGELPDSITVRELEFEIADKGFRTQKVTIVTTLLDHQKYPKAQIVKLYRKRWQIEVNFRHLKTTMKMDVLHSKTYDGVCKEVIIFCLIYNLVWLVIRCAAEAKKRTPQEISFIDALRWLQYSADAKSLQGIIVVKHRPDRVEPRELKRRNKPFKWLTKSRAVRREELRNPNSCGLT